MVGQGYDEASFMSAKEKGFRAVVRQSCPQAVDVHCSEHVLNLVLVKSCAIPEIEGTFDFKGNIASFFKLGGIGSARLTSVIDSFIIVLTRNHSFILRSVLLSCFPKDVCN